MVLAVVFLNNGFLGISTVVVGTKRLIDTRNGERFIDHRQCVLNVCLVFFKKKISEPVLQKNCLTIILIYQLNLL